jgi:hypothetical protein
MYSYVWPDAAISRSVVELIILSRHAENTVLITVVWRQNRSLGV